MPDKYSSFIDLAASEPPQSYRVLARNNGSSVVVAGPHAGGIEPGTSEICLGIAADDFSIYLFEGLKPHQNADLHITSSNFDEPQCLSLLQASDLVVAIHGERSEGEVVYLGGLDTSALTSIRTALEDFRFTVRKHQNPALQGRDRRNICNIGRARAGVQLELSKGLRQTLFASLSPDGRQRPTTRFGAFCRAVRDGLRAQGP